MSFLSKIFSWLKDLFSKIVSVIKKILPYVMAAVAIYLALGFPLELPFLGITIPAGYASAALAMGTSFLLAPEETEQLVSKVATSVGRAVGSVASAIGSASGSLIGGFLTSPGGLILLGLGAWWLFSRSDSHDARSDATPIGAGSTEKTGGISDSNVVQLRGGANG